MKHCNESDIKTALDFIYEDRLLNFYMYMDIEECGITDEGLDMWFFEDDNELKAVAYQYYDCIHIYSKELFCTDELIALLEERKPKVIASSIENIDEILKHLEGDFLYESNHIITADKELHARESFDIKPAVETDIPDIASLMLKADIYSDVYEYDKLVSDLTRRFKDGFGRMFVIRDDEGKLIATNATNAETDELAVIGGLVTDPSMRGKGLGSSITASTWNLVRREGKTGLAFLITTNEKTISVHKKLGFKFIGYNARIIRRD